MIEYVVSGVLAALCVTAARGGEVVLPRCDNGKVQLGFIGRLIVGIASSVVIDGTAERSFLGALVVVAAATGVAFVDRRRARMENARAGGEDERAERLALLRRKLRIAEQNLAMFGPGEAPIHMIVVVEELKAEIARLEGGA